MSKLAIIGGIKPWKFRLFNEKLSQLENELDDGDEVTIDLLTAGGDAYTALAFFDRIKASPLIITVVAYGKVMSAGVLVLAAGDKRIMHSSAWVMVHDDSVIGVDDKRLVDAEKDFRHMRRLENQWNMLLEGVTTTRASVWDDLHRKETYLSAEECLKLGLIEEIV